MTEDSWGEGGKYIPQFAKNLNDLGNTSTISLSIVPVTGLEKKVRYPATTLLSFPSLHSWMNSARFVAEGVTRSARSRREFQVLWALILYHLVWVYWFMADSLG